MYKVNQNYRVRHPLFGCSRHSKLTKGTSLKSYNSRTRRCGTLLKSVICAKYSGKSMDCLELFCMLARFILFVSGHAQQSLASCYYGARPKPTVSFMIVIFKDNWDCWLAMEVILSLKEHKWSFVVIFPVDSQTRILGIGRKRMFFRSLYKD